MCSVLYASAARARTCAMSSVSSLDPVGASGSAGIRPYRIRPHCSYGIRVFRRPSFDPVGSVFEEARCEVFCKNRSKNGSGNHQHEDHIEQSAIDQALTDGVASIEGD